MNCYKVLNLSFDANEKEIKLAYKSLARKYHPDKNPHDSEAASKFNIVKKAYDILKDEKTRKKYDNLLKTSKKEKTIVEKEKNNSKENYNPFKDNVIEDNFNINLFINNYKGNNKSENNVINKDVSISIEDILKGNPIKIKHNNKDFHLNVPKNSQNNDVIYFDNLDESFKINLTIKDIKSTKNKINNVFIKHQVDLKTMLIGGTIYIKIFGEEHKVLLDECTPNGKLITLKGKAFNKADIIVELVVKLPKKINHEIRNYFKKHNNI